MALNWLTGKPNEFQPQPMANKGSDPLIQAIDKTDTDISASAGIIEGRKKRRDAGQPRGPRGAQLSQEQIALSQAFAELYKPEVWEGVMCGPADTMLALSGRKVWNLSPKERSTLSITGAMTAKCFAVENPKWLALILLSVSLIQIYGGRTAIHLAEVAAEKKKAEDAAKTA